MSDVELNPEQRAAVDHGNGPLMILAGAGTGKTATLAARVARLLRDGAPPERVCLLTFSRRAAAEMISRAGRAAPAADAARVVGGTFHSVGNVLLRRHGHLLGLDPAFTVMDASDSGEMFGLVRHELGLDARPGRGDRRFPRKEVLASIWSQVVNGQRPLAEVVTGSFPWCRDHVDAIGGVFDGYVRRKRAAHVLDFDDLLLLWRALGSDGVPGGAGLVASLFDHVLVDEYQDVNRLQADIVAGLSPAGEGLTVVGDDAQAIYGFRAATPDGLLRLPERFPGTTVVALEHNYRSTTPVLAVANLVMEASPTGATKVLWSDRPGEGRPLLRTCADEATQAEAVCDSVLAHREEGRALRDQVVLFRTGHHSDRLELVLAQRQVPFVKFGGLGYLEAAHVKDLLALLRILDNPFDELAWFRVLQLVEGVGPSTAGRIMEDLGVRGDARSAEGGQPLSRLLSAAPTVPAAGREELSGLRHALAECSGFDGGGVPPVAVQLERLGEWLEPVIWRRYDDGVARCADLVALAGAATSSGQRGAFLAELTFDPPSSTAQLAGPPHLDDDWLTLSTVHSAKGGEWDVVHILHAADGMFPSDMACGSREEIEEERRLFYVAVTRARTCLEVNVPLRYHHRRTARSDRHTVPQISRFLTESVTAQMDRAHVGPLGVPAPGAPGSDDTTRAGAAGSAGSPAGVVAVDRALADLWR